MNLDFRRPARELFPAFENFRDAFLAQDSNFWPLGTHWGTARTDLPAYLDWLERSAEGRDLPPRYVPSDAYWVFVDGEMAGEMHVRHYVRATLFLNGGHVGYAVQPKFRRRGIATAMLRFACERLRGLGECEALVTILEGNLASSRVAEKCGGIRIHDSLVDDRPMRRYLIPLTPGLTPER